jgi:hypothetical protein
MLSGKQNYKVNSKREYQDSRKAAGQVGPLHRHKTYMPRTVEKHTGREHPGEGNSQSIPVKQQQKGSQAERVDKDVNTDEKRARHLAYNQFLAEAGTHFLYKMQYKHENKN